MVGIRTDPPVVLKFRIHSISTHLNNIYFHFCVCVRNATDEPNLQLPQSQLFNSINKNVEKGCNRMGFWQKDNHLEILQYHGVFIIIITIIIIHSFNQL